MMNNEQLEEHKKEIKELAQKTMNELPSEVSEDNFGDLGYLRALITDIQEGLYGTKDPTVKSVVQSLYELTSATFYEPISTGELQDLFYQDIETLAELLGIDLE